jgi:hypothetical protein
MVKCRSTARVAGTLPHIVIPKLVEESLMYRKVITKSAL